MISFGPEKILIVLAVALIVLGPEKLPQMTRQIGKAWGDFRRFREHLESEVRGALGDDIVQDLAPWSANGNGSSSASGSSESGGSTSDAAGHDGSPGSEGSPSDGAAQDRAPPREPGHLAPLPPATGSSRPPVHGGWDPGLVPDDPSLN